MKTKSVIFLLTLIFAANFTSIILINFAEYHSQKDLKPKSQGIVQDDYTIEWLDNPTFETPITPWYNVTEGDNKDINATTTLNQANYDILGNSGVLKVDNPLSSSDWTVFQNPKKPVLPDTYSITSIGANVYHLWDESVNQTRNTPSIHWKRNINMPVNMSDYIITSASLSVIFNATVTVSPWNTGGIDRNGDANLDAYAIGDFAEFYILISDINKDQEYQIAYYQTVDLGRDSPATPSIADKVLDAVPENVLISLLSAVLSTDGCNFTITMGIDIYCEDNEYGADMDRWNTLLFKSLNLTFSYQKKIDKFTSLAWNQIGNKITGSNIDIKNATLNFKYKIDKTWTTESPNSEIRIYINNNQFGETIKLSTATSTFQDAKVGGFDITNLILKNVNITLSIKLYLADTFALDQLYSFSIDNASLLISYTETTVEELTNLDIMLNSENKTLEKSIEVTMGYDVNITVMYKDSLNSFIPGANVSLLGVGGPPTLDEDLVYNQYSTVFSSTELSLGNNFFTIEASKKYYETASELINVKVVERNTELALFLDNQDKTIDKSIEMIYGNSGNITITYRDIEEMAYTHISEANVELIGLATPQNLTEDPSNEQYYIYIDTADLGLGNSFLTVNAAKENYTSQSIRFKIEVLERSSYLDNLKLNGLETSSIQIAWDDLLTISVSFNDTFTNSFIDSALVQLTATGISETFIENAPIDYALSIDTEILELGLNFLTISAIKENYTLASQIISISIIERETEIEIYLNGTDSSLFEFYTISIGEELNITVIYKDLISDTFIDLAVVKLIESGVSQNLTKHSTFDQYNISILADDLGSGVKFITISANQDNYTLSSELITLIINEKKTQMLLSLNGTPYSNGDTLKLEISDLLNITVKYLDNVTLDFLSGATVDLIGGGLLTENVLNEYYNITINIFDLNSTLNRIIIRAQLPNFQTALIEFFIQVIERESDGRLFLNEVDKTDDPYIELTIGNSLNITINYYDNRTEEHISGATVQLSGDIYRPIDEDILYNQYSTTINTTELGVGLSIFTIIAERANFELFIIQTIYLNVLRINTTIKTVQNVTTFEIRPGGTVNLSIVLENVDFGGTIKGATVNYRWAFGVGVLKDDDNDGIYTIILSDIPEGTFPITITAYKGNDYDFETLEVVVSVTRPIEEVIFFQTLATTGGIIAALLVIYLYLYQKILKFPKSVRKVHKYSKTLNKSKDPNVKVVSRNKAFESAYKSELTKTSKSLSGKPSEPPVTKDKLLTKTD